MAEHMADLVLEGGGVKGIALVGAAAALAGQGWHFQRVAGTSSGAVVGSLLAAGLPMERIETIMGDLDYRAFCDESLLDRFGVVGKGLSLLFEQGVYEGKYLRDWLDGLLTEAGAATFGDLRFDDPGGALASGRSYRLVVNVSDVTAGRLVRLPWDYARYGLDPDTQRVADAVAASAAIPFFYEPVRLRYADGGPDALLVDGGILSNFPVGIFDRDDGGPRRWPTIGVKLSARPGATAERRFEVNGTVGFARALLGTMAGFHDQIHIDDPDVVARTIFIDTMDVLSTDFDLDEATREALYRNGRAAAVKFLANPAKRK